MLEQYFRRRHVVTRLRSEPLGQLLEEFAVYLHNRGHSTFTVQGYLWATERFGRWLALHKIEIEAVNEGQLQSFLQDQASRHSKHKPPNLSVDARAGLHHFLRMLRCNEHVPATPTRPITPPDRDPRRVRSLSSKRSWFGSCHPAISSSLCPRFSRWHFRQWPNPLVSTATQAHT